MCDMSQSFWTADLARKTMFHGRLDGLLSAMTHADRISKLSRLTSLRIERMVSSKAPLTNNQIVLRVGCNGEAHHMRLLI